MAAGPMRRSRATSGGGRKPAAAPGAEEAPAAAGDGLLRTSVRLALPYNHARGYPEWLARHLAGVAEVFLPLHGSIVASGRIWGGPKRDADYLAALRELAAVMNPQGLTANLAVNVIVGRERHRAATRAVGRMLEIFDRVSVTVTDFEFARDLRRGLPTVELGVSTLADVDGVQRATFWRDEVGAAVITVSRAINKRLDAIRAVRDCGLRIKIVLDDECVPSCPAQAPHLARLRDGDRRFAARCAMQAVRTRSRWLLAQKDIVPATLPRYDGLVDVAKIAGRDRTLSFIERMVALYLEARSFAHSHGQYVEPPEAFDMICACDRDCERCGWCPKHIKPAPRVAGPTRAGGGVRERPPGAAPVRVKPGDRRRQLGLVAAAGDAAAALRVAVRFADATQEPCLLEVRARADTPTPFLGDEHLGLTFFGRSDALSPLQAAALDAAGRALLQLGQGAPSLAALAARIAGSDLAALRAGRDWWLSLPGPARAQRR